MHIFSHTERVRPEWIDYNGHMQDAYYGLIFSFAVDALQDEVGFDEAYRKSTGRTIYLLEDHKYFLKEVKEGETVRVETRVVNCDRKRFQLYMTMLVGANIVAVSEVMELHVNTKPKPHGEDMPNAILHRLEQAMLSDSEVAKLAFRARSMAIK